VQNGHIEQSDDEEAEAEKDEEIIVSQGENDEIMEEIQPESAQD
jgi:hypothetical protein